jgi:DNA-binding NtrC family response regulator
LKAARPPGPPRSAASSLRRESPETIGDLVQPLVGRDIADVERALVLKTLELCRGNRTRAARILGVSARTIHNKLRLWRTATEVGPDPAVDPPSGTEA